MSERRRGVLGLVLMLISLPTLLALSQAVSFYTTNRSNGTIMSSGLAREYLLHVPTNYDRTKPTPLVISLHGGALWPAAQRRIDRWDRVADAHGFILVYPSGVSGRGPRAWSAGREPGLTRDVRFISDLIDTLRAAYLIDTARIYASGLSNGGGMAFALSCRLSERIAAIGVVSTAIFLPWSGCGAGRAVPLVVFQGTADRAIPYHGGTSWVAPDVFPDVPAWTARWAVRNRCDLTPVERGVAPDVVRIEHPDCAGHSAVVLYRIEGGGHTWPGGEPLAEWFVGRTSQGIDATGVMWQFFREHPLATK
jgi:polyhydroxybutyrate depolymerase